MSAYTLEQWLLQAKWLLNNLKHVQEHSRLCFFFLVLPPKQKFFFTRIKMWTREMTCADPYDIPHVMPTKFPTSVMALGVVSSEAVCVSIGLCSCSQSCSDPKIGWWKICTTNSHQTRNHLIHKILIPLTYVWGIVEQETNQHSHNATDSLSNVQYQYRPHDAYVSTLPVPHWSHYCEGKPLHQINMLSNH